jgi:hypothetical protein
MKLPGPNSSSPIPTVYAVVKTVHAVAASADFLLPVRLRPLVLRSDAAVVAIQRRVRRLGLESQRGRRISLSLPTRCCHHVTCPLHGSLDKDGGASGGNSQCRVRRSDLGPNPWIKSILLCNIDELACGVQIRQ